MTEVMPFPTAGKLLSALIRTNSYHPVICCSNPAKPSRQSAN
jgi:hypothetical protein